MTWNTSRRLQQPEMSCAVKVYHSDTQKRILSLSLSVLLFVTLLFSSNYHPHYHQQVPDSRDTLITLQPVNYHSYRPRGSNWQYQTEDCCLLLEMLSEMKIHNFRTTLRNKEKKKCLLLMKLWFHTREKAHTLAKQQSNVKICLDTTVK